MKALFNGPCDRCGHDNNPRCAVVWLRIPGAAREFYSTPVTLCERCRKEKRGQFKYHQRHR